VRRALAALAIVLGVGLNAVGTTAAQDATSTSSTVAVPSQEIVPQPNSGAPPQEAGDRGGALQLGLLALVVVAVGGGVAFVVVQSKRARSD
jgi:uncharacterized protein HemX